MLDKCIAVLTGTKDVYHPLYKFLVSSLKNPVYLWDIEDTNFLLKRLEQIAANTEIWIFPSNELSLNAIHEILADSELLKSGQVIIPGTAYLNRLYSSAELSDKETLVSLFKNKIFKNFKKVKTEVVSLPLADNTIAEFKGLVFPAVMKPATKDKADSFSEYFPAKMVILRELKHWDTLRQDFPGSITGNRKFIFQEILSGINISWCGYACGGKAFGYKIVSQVKSPEGTLGGTTTLAYLESSDTILTEAVNELVEVLKLEGIFEIEFIEYRGQLYFLYEVNPRPWLQVSLALTQPRNIFIEYLTKHGLTAAQGPKPKKNSPKFWGSTWRYLKLNPQNISWSIFMKTLFYDVRLRSYFNLREKAKYCFSVLRILLKRLAKHES